MTKLQGLLLADFPGVSLVLTIFVIFVLFFASLVIAE